VKQKGNFIVNLSQIDQLHELIQQITQCSTLDEIIFFLRKISTLKNFSQIFPIEDEYILHCLNILEMHQVVDLILESKQGGKILEKLKEVDRFYQSKGGLLGYQAIVLSHLQPRKNELGEFFPPKTIPIQNKTQDVEESIDCGLEHLPKFCEIYVVGGAADRLGFFSPETNDPLPAASFVFLGKPLLKHLIDDLVARECLYEKQFGKKVTTTICLMTSDETNNDKRIKELLKENHYFGRPEESFLFIRQPMVPVVDLHGKWVVDQELLFKPSGHGALWMAAINQSIFAELKTRGYEFALIRQINNPIIGMDYNLLAFMGIGVKEKKKFGFFVTPRLKGQAEGAIVFKEVNQSKVVSNVEYCNIENVELTDDFPANTNLLFLRLDSIEEAIQANPYPGSLLNFKLAKDSIPIGRLELTMQNIAEGFLDQHLDMNSSHQSVFLVQQERNKAISTIKRLKSTHEELYETPIRALYDLSKEIYGLLKTDCHFQLPTFSKSVIDFIKKTPFLFLYHPILGPTFSKIAEKLQNWTLGQGSLTYLEIAMIQAKNVKNFGRLKIKADNPFDSVCILNDVTIHGREMNENFLEEKQFDPIICEYDVEIHLEKGAIFEASQTVFLKNEQIHVPAFHVLRVEKNIFSLKKLPQPSLFIS
jgi:UDP-N-acetylglucosamine pyrophosphorylase